MLAATNLLDVEHRSACGDIAIDRRSIRRYAAMRPVVLAMAPRALKGRARCSGGQPPLSA